MLKTESPATPSQKQFIQKLLNERSVPECLEIDIANLSKLKASKAIELLLARPLIAPDVLSDKQLRYLTSLLEKRPDTDRQIKRILVTNQVTDLSKLNREQAKRTIDHLLKLPVPIPTLEVGAYELEGVVYSVRKLGYSDRIVAYIYDSSIKRWLPDTTKTIFKLKPEDRLTLERASMLSVAVGSCVHCGRTLTLQKSVVAGMGRTCASKYH
jgi:hypothetical protein